MGKLYSLIWALFITVGNVFAASPSAYEWWFDNEYDSRSTGGISTDNINLTVDASLLSPGLHYFNCRLFADEDGWGSIYRDMIFKAGPTTDITKYEYWLDNNYSNKVEGNISNGDNLYAVDFKGVRKGLHSFNYRICDSNGKWGSIFTNYFFFATSEPQFTTYEYWFDNDYENRKSETIDKNPMTFDIDLTGFDKSGGAHFFNLRARDEDGAWGSIYRKLIVFYKDEHQAPIIGYRHSFNGNDLGYVPVDRSLSDSYTFETDIPDNLGIEIRNIKPIFEENKVSIRSSVSVNYVLQLQSELGWSSPTIWDLESTVSHSTEAIDMPINSSRRFEIPRRLEFSAFKFTSEGQNLYMRSDIPISLDIYRDGEKALEISASELKEMASVTLEKGEYFGILRDAEEKPGESFTFHLMDTPNMVPNPTIKFENGFITISCSREDAEIHYTLDGSIPTTESAKYDQPVSIDHNLTVKAIAVLADNSMAPSYITEFVISSFKCDNAAISYNGRFATITAKESEAEIRYSLNGDDPEDALVYTGTFDTEGRGIIKAIVMKPGYNNSDISEYMIQGYADELHAETSTEGVLESCYGWAGNELIENIEKVSIEGYLNPEDYSFLRQMRSLNHLDLSKVENAVLPDAAFANMKLITVSMPEKMVEYGKTIFSGNSYLCAIVWNSKDIKAEDRLLEDISNPNLLLYLPYTVDLNVKSLRNKIEDGHSAEIELTDGYPFHAPREFIADEISFSRNFSKETIISECAGWETITLPFDVEEIRDAKGLIVPFMNSTETDRPFWLYRPDGMGWSKTDKIFAYEPYLLSMPNNPDYIEEYNISGKVTFSASGTTVSVTPEPEGFTYKGDFYMHPNFMNASADNALWVINDEWIEGNPPGSIFGRAIRDVRPFECYLTSDISKRHIPVFDNSEVDTIMEEYDIKIWNENHDICIMSGISQIIRIYDTVGQLIHVAKVRAGELYHVHDLAPGIYVAAGKKIMIK